MKRKKTIKLIISLLLILLEFSSLVLFSYSLYLYKGVETFYRYYVIIILLYLFVVLGYSLLRSIKKVRWIKFVISAVVTLLLIVCQAVGYYYLTRVYNALDSFSTNPNSYYTSLVSFNKDYKSYKDLKNAKIGIINDTNDLEGNVLPLEAIDKIKLDNKNEIIKYDSTMELMYDLSNKKIDAGFLSSNYVEIFSSMEGYEEIGNNSVILYDYEKTYKDGEEPIEQEKTNADLTKPFTMLIIGIDSSKDGVTSGYNADVLILITFNPKTLQATMTSVPRDMYMQTACSGKNYRRINTTTWGSSSSCAIQTIEKLFDVDVDYYAKINFKGVVQLVDAVGGIDVDVPYAICEQNSSRQWGENTVYIKAGRQHLNGEQALAFARNRHGWPANCSAEWNTGTRNDYVRGRNQMKAIVGVANQIRNLTSPNQAIEILEIISKNFQTNVSSQKMLSLYDLAKTIAFSKEGNIVNIQRMQLSGYSLKVWDVLSKSYPSVTIPSTGSIKLIKEQIKINLGKKSGSLIKKTSFDINNQFKEEVIGSGVYSGTRLATLKNFSGQSVSSIKSYASSNGLSVKFVDIDSKNDVSISEWGTYSFHSQKEHKDTLLKLVNSLTIYVKKASSKTTDNTSTKTDKTTENDNNKEETKQEEAKQEEKPQTTEPETSEQKTTQE